MQKFHYLYTSIIRVGTIFMLKKSDTISGNTTKIYEIKKYIRTNLFIYHGYFRFIGRRYKTSGSGPFMFHLA